MAIESASTAACACGLPAARDAGKGDRCRYCRAVAQLAKLRVDFETRFLDLVTEIKLARREHAEAVGLSGGPREAQA